jgi:hypothetical protein
MRHESSRKKALKYPFQPFISIVDSFQLLIFISQVNDSIKGRNTKNTKQIVIAIIGVNIDQLL